MYRVKKRDGRAVDFDIKRVSNAIKKAFMGCQREYNNDVIDMISLRITSDAERKVVDGLVDVESIQDSAEKVLCEVGYYDVAKAYILYRKSHENIRNIATTTLDYQNIVDTYLKAIDTPDQRRDNISHSVGGMILSNNVAITANYWLNQVYDGEICDAHRNGNIHVHDLGMLMGSRSGWSLEDLIKEGLGGVAGKVSCTPAKHLDALCDQIVNFLGIMQNEWAGAMSISHFDTYLAAFVKAERLTYEEVLQSMQRFIYGVNMPSRWGTQTPFSAVCLDWVIPSYMKDKRAFACGRECGFTYGDCLDEAKLICQTLLEVIKGNDASGNPFRYPMCQFTITSRFGWDDTRAQLLYEMSYKTKLVSFAVCDDDKDPGFCGATSNSGFIGIASVNLPRIAFLSQDKESFFLRLDRMVDLCVRSLKIKRTVLDNLLAHGLYPYTQRYLKDLSRHAGVVSVIGLNEACINAPWIGKDLSDEDAAIFAKEVMEYIKERVAQNSKEGRVYVLSSANVQSVLLRLAKHDLKKYPSIMTRRSKTPCYSPGCQLPYETENDIFARLDAEASFLRDYPAIDTYEAYHDGTIDSPMQAKVLIQKITLNYRIPFFRIAAQN